MAKARRRDETTDDDAPEVVTTSTSRASALEALESAQRAHDAQRAAAAQREEAFTVRREAERAASAARRSEREQRALEELLGSRGRRSTESSADVLPRVIRPQRPKKASVTRSDGTRVVLLSEAVTAHTSAAASSILRSREEMLRTRTAARRVSVSAASASLYRPYLS